MKGCIQWKTVSEHGLAYKSWLCSLDLFEELRGLSMILEQTNWYTERIDQIEQYLEDQISLDCYPPPRNNPSGYNPVHFTAEAFLQLFPVGEEIPAGGFAAVGFNSDFTIGVVEVNQVLINEQLYRIYSLHGLGRENTLTDKHCVVVKIKGDSMNNPSRRTSTSVPIDDGDYVLLAEQDNAQSGDIVAAEIDRIADSLATLKRYQVLRDKILLKPESTNRAFQTPFEFTAGDPQVHIRGVALAVFKPVT